MVIDGLISIYRADSCMVPNITLLIVLSISKKVLLPFVSLIYLTIIPFNVFKGEDIREMGLIDFFS